MAQHAVTIETTPAIPTAVVREAPTERVVASALPAGRAARTVLRGPPSPEGLESAHDAVLRWCEANGERPARMRWEVYGHWRDEDPDGFETEIYRLLSASRSSAS